MIPASCGDAGPHESTISGGDHEFRVVFRSKVMNVAVLLIVAVVLFFLAYHLYARFIAKLFGENDN